MLGKSVRCVAGMIIYLGYGVWHSSERRSDDTQVILYDIADNDDRDVTERDDFAENHDVTENDAG